LAEAIVVSLLGLTSGRPDAVLLVWLHRFCGLGIACMASTCSFQASYRLTLCPANNLECNEVGLSLLGSATAVLVRSVVQARESSDDNSLHSTPIDNCLQLCACLLHPRLYVTSSQPRTMAAVDGLKPGFGYVLGTACASYFV
jgi:hypothetical protein